MGNCSDRETRPCGSGHFWSLPLRLPIPRSSCYSQMGQKNRAPMTVVCLALLIPSLSFWDPQGVLNKDKVIAETVFAPIPREETVKTCLATGLFTLCQCWPVMTGAHSRELWRVPDASLPQRIDSYLTWKAKLRFLSWLEACPAFAHLGMPEGNPTPLGETV